MDQGGLVTTGHNQVVDGVLFVRNSRDGFRANQHMASFLVVLFCFVVSGLFLVIHLDSI